MKRRLGAGLIATAMLAILAFPLPAHAGATGAVAARCNFLLPVSGGWWPPLATLDCVGNATGVLTGKTTTGQRYAIAPVNDRFVLSVKYFKKRTCVPDLKPDDGKEGPIWLGDKGSGSFTIGSVNSLVPAGTASIYAPFAWSRTGPIVSLALGRATISLPGGRVAYAYGGAATGGIVQTKPATSPQLLCGSSTPIPNVHLLLLLGIRFSG